MKKAFVMVFFFFFLFLVFPLLVQANNMVLLDSSQSQYTLAPYIDILEDKEKKWTIADVSSGAFSNRFSPIDQTYPNFGYVSSAYWVRIQISNTSSEKEWWLEIAAPPIDRVTLYTPNRIGGFTAKTAGDIFPLQDKDIPHRNVVFAIHPAQMKTETFYLRIETEGAMQFPLLLWEPQAFAEASQAEFLIIGIVTGILLAIALYNLFLFFSLRMYQYLYYVLFVFSSLCTQLAYNGIGYEYIWPNSPQWNNVSIIFFMACSIIWGALSARDFLNIKVYAPKINPWLLGCIFAGILTLLLLPFSYKLSLQLVMLSTGISTIMIIVAGALCWVKGYRPARYYLLAWLLFFLCSALSSMIDEGHFTGANWMRYSFQFGAVLESLLLSFALADKINMMRREKELAEAETKKSQQLALESLHRLDKLKDEFVATTSHELRTPLHGIMGIADSLLAGAAGPLSEQTRKNISMISTSASRLSRLVNDMLDVSQLKNQAILLYRKPVRIQDITRAVLEFAAYLAQNKALEFHNRIPDSFPPVYGDENRIQQILYNLIGNAVKFTEAGRIEVAAEVSGVYAKIFVKDTGIGIPEEKLEIIFKEFEQGDIETHRRFGGSGLGLSITKGFIEMHGGTIKAASEEGGGATFVFTLPLAQQAEQEVAASSAVVSYEKGVTRVAQEVTPYRVAAEKVRGTILIVDDEPINLQVLINHLVLEGYHVSTRNDGEEAIHAFEEHGGFDLVILDIMMPKLSGYEICRLLRQHNSLTELPILIVTAKNQPEDIIAAFEAGANDYITKPFDRRELLARVHTLLSLRQAIQEVREHAKELSQFNEKLEVKIRERTRELEQMHWKNAEALAEKSVLEERNRIAGEIHDIVGHSLTTTIIQLEAGKRLLMKDPMLVMEKLELTQQLIRNGLDEIRRSMQMLRSEQVAFSLEQSLIQLLQETEQHMGVTIDYQISPLPELSPTQKKALYHALKEGLTNGIRHGKSTHFLFSLRQENGNLYFALQDNGKGDERPLFGFGLSTMCERIEESGGTLHVHTEPGAGYRINIVVPVTDI
ncbi:7TM diverse intracellular signaling domain-containing protein [Aneurinibacillus sp. REN35]|uniref:7TM diverse intracellular signaling domain-containing protein n=1 Tax=Aneurinibacillus sp. REN35 TaxID=3237286 RepID=UPI003527ACDA